MKVLYFIKSTILAVSCGKVFSISLKGLFPVVYGRVWTALQLAAAMPCCTLLESVLQCTASNAMLHAASKCTPVHCQQCDAARCYSKCTPVHCLQCHAARCYFRVNGNLGSPFYCNLFPSGHYLIL